MSNQDEALQKAILIAEAPADALTHYLAKLALPRRALSLPATTDVPASMPNFIELWGRPGQLRNVLAEWPHPARAWLVREVIPMAYEQTWRSGEPSPGPRRVSTVHRRPGMTRADFERYWCGPHTAVARSYTVPVWHYVQNIVIEPLGHSSDLDGFVGMHFRTAEDLRARWQDYPDEAARGADDAAKFMVLERAVSITAVETVWHDPA